MASELIVQTLKGPTSGANANKIIVPSGQTLDASAGDMTLPAGVGGKVLQVIQNKTDDVTSYSGTSHFTWNASKTSITPSSTSSKILVRINVHYSATSNAYVSYRLMRNGSLAFPLTGSGTGIETHWASYTSQSSSAEYRVFQTTFEYLDSPSSTSQQEYSIGVSPMRTSAYTWRSNQSINLGDDNQYRSLHSTITLMEIAG